MSSWYDLAQVGSRYDGVCVGFDGDSYLTKLVVMYDYFPVFLTCFMFGLTLTHLEVFYWLLTMVVFIDTPFNFFLQSMIGASDNLQPPACPIRVEQMPPAGAQQIVALWTVGWGFALILFPRVVSGQKIAFFAMFNTFALYTRIYLIFNSTAQILAAAAIGCVEGVLYLVVVHYLNAYRIVDVIVRLPFLTWLGTPIDTMLDPDVFTIYLPHGFKRIRFITDNIEPSNPPPVST